MTRPDDDTHIHKGLEALRADAEQVEADVARGAALLPPMRGLDERAGDVEDGVIGSGPHLSWRWLAAAIVVAALIGLWWL
jgi:hypothetical protein